MRYAESLTLTSLASIHALVNVRRQLFPHEKQGSYSIRGITPIRVKIYGIPILSIPVLGVIKKFKKWK